MKNNKQKKSILLLAFLFGFSIIFLLLGDSSYALEVQSYKEISGKSVSSGSNMGDLAVYVFNLCMSVGFGAAFISIAIAGAMWALSPALPSLRSSAKDRFMGAISGLLLIIFTYLIVTTINPDFKNFNLTKMPSVTVETPEETELPGVYFNNDENPKRSSIPDLSTLANKVDSVRIVDGESQYYISILYNDINFHGKCLYVADTANNVKWANSASIHNFNTESNGDGVYFYRKGYFDKKGGYVKINNSEISNVFVGELSQMKFTGSNGGNNCNVPDEEQDCIKYDKEGRCCEEGSSKPECNESGRTCPTLANDGVSSVEIKGDYLVLFVYFSTTDSENGPWTYCQEFPTIDDVNRTGPQQIKWQFIRNSEALVPNYVVIVPI